MKGKFAVALSLIGCGGTSVLKQVQEVKTEIKNTVTEETSQEEIISAQPTHDRSVVTEKKAWTILM